MTQAKDGIETKYILVCQKKITSITQVVCHSELDHNQRLEY